MITQFRGDYAFLSNFHYSPFTFHVPERFYGNAQPVAMEYAVTVEHAYQALKAAHYVDFLSVLNADHASVAKNRGRSLVAIPEWNSIKLTIMNDLVRRKFKNHPHLAKKLLETYPHELIEGNYWKDYYWGMDLQSGRGDNNLGRILMAVRNELRNELLIGAL